MSGQSYRKVTGAIFLLIALVHGYEVVTGQPGSIAGNEFPLWGSVVSTLLALYLAYVGLKKI